MKSIEEAIATLTNSAAIQAQALETGDYKNGNRRMRLMMQCIVYLYEQNHLADLKPLLYHQNIGVRSTAAYALLPLMEKESITVLQEIADNDYGIHSFDAERMIKRWKKHEIIFPYQEGYHW